MAPPPAAATVASAPVHVPLALQPPVPPLLATTTGPVPAALEVMATAVQRGDWGGAEAAGAAGAATQGGVHLSLPRAALRLGSPLAKGAQAAVFAAQLAVPGGGWVDVAVKRPLIREAAGRWLRVCVEGVGWGHGARTFKATRISHPSTPTHQTWSAFVARCPFWPRCATHTLCSCWARACSHLVRRERGAWGGAGWDCRCCCCCCWSTPLRLLAAPSLTPPPPPPHIPLQTTWLCCG